VDTSERAAQIRALFDDGGEAVLREAGLPGGWEQALSELSRPLPGSADALQMLSGMREQWAATNRLRPAIAATRGLLRLRIASSGHDHPDTYVELGALGALAQRAGRVAEGGDMLVRAWEGIRRTAGGRDMRLAVVSSNVGLHYVRTGNLEEAERALEVSYRIRKDLAPASVGHVAAQLGEVRLARGSTGEAVDLLGEALEVYRVTFGAEHPRTDNRAQALGALLVNLGRYAEAAAVLRSVAARSDQAPADRRAAVDFDYGVAMYHSGGSEEGLRRIEAAVRATRAMSSEDGTPDRALASRVTVYAGLQLERRRAQEAEGLLQEAVEAERRLHGEDSVQIAERYANLGTFLAKCGRIDEALGFLDVSASLMRSLLGDGDRRTRSVVIKQVSLLLARAKQARERSDQALEGMALTRAFQLAEPVLGYTDARTREIRARLERLGLST